MQSEGFTGAEVRALRSLKFFHTNFGFFLHEAHFVHKGTTFRHLTSSEGKPLCYGASTFVATRLCDSQVST